MAVFFFFWIYHWTGLKRLSFWHYTLWEQRGIFTREQWPCVTVPSRGLQLLRCSPGIFVLNVWVWRRPYWWLTDGDTALPSGEMTSLPLQNIHLRAGEMSQWVKCLPRNPCKGGSREQAPHSCPPVSTCIPWHHSHTTITNKLHLKKKPDAIVWSSVFFVWSYSVIDHP